MSLLPPQEAIPFAVVGSTTVIEVNNKKVRGRQYPWGVVEGEWVWLFVYLGVAIS